MVGADAVHGEARGAGRRRSIRRRARRASSCRPTTPTRSTATSPAPLVYVNYGVPAGLRGARAARHLGEGRDRHRALRRVVARHQAEGRRRARRGRLPDLLRSARRRLLRAATCFPKGPMRNADGVQRGSVMDMPVYPGDPLTPGVGATPDAKRLDLKDAHDADEDSGAADLVRRRAAAARGARGPVAPAAWRGALPITYHIGPGPATRAPEGGVQLGHQAAVRRHRAASRARRIPTSGSSAATITTRG